MDDVFYQKFVAIAVGNLMEWYDFAVFGSFADVIAGQFFPTEAGSNLGLLKSFAVFGAAFYARPLGVSTTRLYHLRCRCCCSVSVVCTRLSSQLLQ